MLLDGILKDWLLFLTWFWKNTWKSENRSLLDLTHFSDLGMLYAGVDKGSRDDIVEMEIAIRRMGNNLWAQRWKYKREVKQGQEQNLWIKKSLPKCPWRTCETEMTGEKKLQAGTRSVMRWVLDTVWPDSVLFTSCYVQYTLYNLVKEIERRYMAPILKVIIVKQWGAYNWMPWLSKSV